MRLRIHHVLLLISLVIFVSAGFVLFRYVESGNKEQAVFDELKTRISNSNTTNNDTPPGRYLAAYGENSDYVGWLTVSGTAIDYPVMMTPDDPQYYLHKSFEKEESKSGTLFIGEGCTDKSSSAIIYGHNMKNDTMFGTLDEFKDRDFWAQNKYFSFETDEGTSIYEVFGACEAKIPSASSAEKMYYDYVSDISEDDFSTLIGWFKDHSLYQTDITPEYGENLIMLSTCSYHTDDGRFVIIGHKVE